MRILRAVFLLALCVVPGLPCLFVWLVTLICAGLVDAGMACRWLSHAAKESASRDGGG